MPTNANGSNEIFPISPSRKPWGALTGRPSSAQTTSFFPLGPNSSDTVCPLSSPTSMSALIAWRLTGTPGHSFPVRASQTASMTLDLPCPLSPETSTERPSGSMENSVRALNPLILMWLIFMVRSSVFFGGGGFGLLGDQIADLLERGLALRASCEPL
jgi:hypothetical protein